MSRQDFVPRPTDATGAYWDATRERRLVLQYCPSCEAYVHHPREVCPRCLDRDLIWRESLGRGRVHAFSVHQRPSPPMTIEDCPYVVAFVDLDDGPRFLSNLFSTDTTAIAIGDAVVLDWMPVGDGYNLPVFVPSG